jgi:hypothetical protein
MIVLVLKTLTLEVPNFLTLSDSSTIPTQRKSRLGCDRTA